MPWCLFRTCYCSKCILRGLTWSLGPRHGSIWATALEIPPSSMTSIKCSFRCEACAGDYAPAEASWEGSPGHLGTRHESHGAAACEPSSHAEPLQKPSQQVMPLLAWSGIVKPLTNDPKCKRTRKTYCRESFSAKR